MIVAHSNSLRALVECLDKITDKEIIELNIPQILWFTSLILISKRVRHFYLADEKMLKDAMAEVATIAKNQI